MAVFVLDRSKHPLMPCSEKRARLLLERKRARIHRRFPFTIRLVDRTQGESALQELRLKLDPGSKGTGLAIVRTVDARQQHVLHLAELEHRGALIHKKLQQRAAYRGRRRSRNLRYRAPRFDNRTRPPGWLPPSLQHRVITVHTWVTRVRQLAPITRVTMELATFDTQALVNPQISGVEYQQGTLAGYEIRGYLLEKWGRTCVYCDAREVPLQIEHILPKSLGGTNRVANLTLSCQPCNALKGNQRVELFLADQPDRLLKILKQAEAPLQDAAAVNATRLAIKRMLDNTGLPVETGTGGRTKWNRSRMDIPKTHATDAAAAGSVDQVHGWDRPILAIRCMGRGSHQRTRVTKDGFPRGYLTRVKTVRGFRTGDIVRAIVPTGKHAGTYVGRVAVRQTGHFNIQMAKTTVQGISWKHCQVLQRADGYAYSPQSRPSARPSSIRLKAMGPGPRWKSRRTA